MDICVQCDTREMKRFCEKINLLKQDSLIFKGTLQLGCTFLFALYAIYRENKTELCNMNILNTYFSGIRIKTQTQHF